MSDSSSSDVSNECIVCFGCLYEDDPYALPDDDCESNKKCHPECLENWYTNYSNRGLITDKQIKTFKIYHLGNPIETIQVRYKPAESFPDPFSYDSADEHTPLTDNQYSDSYNDFPVVVPIPMPTLPTNPMTREEADAELAIYIRRSPRRRCLCCALILIFLLVVIVTGAALYLFL